MKRKSLLILLVLSLSLISLGGSISAKDGDAWAAKVISSSKISEVSKIEIYKDYTYGEILGDMLDLDLISNEDLDLKLSEYEKIKSEDGISLKYRKVRGESYTVEARGGEYVLTPYFYIGLKACGQDLNNAEKYTIVSVESPYLEIENEGDYSLQGGIFYKLEAGDSIYYGVNGDLKANRHIQDYGGLNWLIGRLLNLYIGSLNVDYHIKNFQFDGRLYFPGYMR